MSSGLWPQDSARTARVPSALRGSQLGEGCAWAPPLAPPRLSLSGSRLQPSRLLLSLLHRLKTATVPELTPGDPESFLPHPLAHRHSVFSESAELWAATGRLLLPHLPYTAGLWGAGTRSTPPQPVQPTSAVGGGRAASGRTGRPFFPLSPPLLVPPHVGAGFRQKSRERMEVQGREGSLSVLALPLPGTRGVQERCPHLGFCGFSNGVCTPE